MKVIVVGLVVSLALLMVLKATFATSAVSQAQRAEELVKVDQLNAQVVQLYAAGRFDEAMPLAKQALELTEKLLGPSDVAVPNVASNLAELYIAKGKYKEAEPLLLRAIEINDKALNPDDPILIRTLERYTCVLHKREQDDKLKDFDESRLRVLNASTQADRFWGALWRATKLIQIPKPEYPAAARGVASGRVLIEVSVDEEGKVIKTQDMCGGNVFLVKVAEESAKRAQFKPLVVNGQPVRIIGYLLYRFALQ